jgi:hypothetical protein
LKKYCKNGFYGPDLPDIHIIELFNNFNY